MAWDENEYGTNVSNEKRDQNTPTGWTEVALPNITSHGEYNITSCGASTSSSNNATAINNAISAANAAGGGIVIIPAGTWLSGPITMKSNVVLHLKAGATLMMLPFGQYPDGGSHDETFSYKDHTFIGNGSSDVNDIIIEGEGETSIIDGQGAPWWVKVEEAKRNDRSFDRHACIRMKKGTRHLFRNFKIQNTPGVNLTVGNKTQKGHVTIHDLWIKNPDSELSSGASHNTDGIPIWEPYVNIYNCTIDTGDDNIVCDSEAHHIHAWNINCKSGHGMSVGSYTVNTHDIIYEGVTFNGTGSGFRIKTSADRSGNNQTGTNGAVKDIICRNATMTGCPSPIKITSWYDSDKETPSSNTTSTVTATTPEFCDILFQNITASAVSGKTSWKHNRPVYLYGRPEMYIHDVTFDNVKINSVLGMFMAFAKNITFKNGCKITNEANSSKILTTEYLAYSDNGSTLLSANASKYNGSESATTYPVKFMNGSTVYKQYNICPNSYAYPPTAPTKSGDTFLGWATTEGGTPVTIAQTPLAQGGTFYAVWESGEAGGGDDSGDGSGDGTVFSLVNTATSNVTVEHGKEKDLSTYATITGGSAEIHNGHADTDNAMITASGLKFGNSGGSYVKITLNSPLKEGDVLITTGGDGGLVALSSSNADSDNISGNKFTFTSEYDNKTVIYINRGSSKPILTSITITREGPESPDPEPVAVKPAAKKAFDFVVGRDGTIDEAIAAANAWTGSGRYLIFVPDGRHKMTGNAIVKTKDSYSKDSEHTYYKWDEATGNITSGLWNTSTEYSDNAMTWLKKSNVSIIGQSMNGTEIYNIPYIWGISYTSTLEIRSGYSNTYLQDFTLKNLYAGGANDKGVAVAFYDRGTNTIAKNLNAWSNQDTYTSAATRCYYETSTFAGTVDFICGSGDVWFEKCDLVINDRSGNVITAPSTAATEQWGYIFNGCTISKAEGATQVTDKNWNLGRPWKNAPASTFINTKMNVLPKDAGWTNMTDGLAIRFHEYGSTNSSGTLLDLTSRSVSACKGAKADNPVLTEVQASKYKVSSVVGGDNNWDPRALTLQVGVSNVQLNGNTLLWDANDYALCWVVFKDGVFYDDVTENSITLSETGTYTVRAANSMGGLGEETSGVAYTAPITHNVKFYDGAVQFGETQSIEEGQTVSAPSPAPTKTDYTFKGWSLTNGGTTLVTFPYTVTADVNFYAVWEQEQQGGDVDLIQNVTFNLSGKSGSPYHDVQDGTSLDIAKSSGLNWASDTRGLRWTQNTTLSFTAPEGCYISSITFVSGSNGNSVGNMSNNIAVKSGDISLGNWNGITTKAQSYTWESNMGRYSPLSFTNNSTGDIYVSGINVTYVRYAVTATVLSTRKFGSFSSLYNIDFGTDENAAVQAYTVKVKDATSVVLTRHYGVLPAAEGVVLYAPGTTKSQTFNVAASATALTIDNDMIGVPVATYVEKDATGGHAYVVNSDAFKPLSASGTIAAGKAYIRIPSSSGGAKAISMMFNDDNATGISNYDFFNTNTSVNKIYNLQGIEVKNPIRGRIYIINNKKCIFK